jgi:aspartyl-tRNA(Asn)/glutamyl-tRNA(Gln) amidotransferase subunit B
MDYDIVIGLEIHSELNTESKIFCSCKNEFGSEPNTHCCPVCSGHPGVLPVLNRKAVEYTVKAGLALNCRILEFSKFDRKNYYYPDLPKAYQISQFDLPLCKDGFLEFTSGGKTSKVRINRIHLEEDAGKLIHSPYGSGTLVDYNRCGVPLIEIVTEPDMTSPEEAIAFLENIKSVLQFTGVSDCKMEEGSLRCDINLSLKPKGSEKLGVRSEMKNVNSFKAAYRAMVYEVKRQTEILNSGGKVLQETRRWDDNANKSFSMRSKEYAHDYRYFPEPDLVPLVLTKEYIEKIKAELPELPSQRRKKYVNEYGLPQYDADVLTSEKFISDFFESCCKLYDNKKALSNWVMGDIMRKLKENGGTSIAVSPENFISLLKLYDSGAISQNAAKIVFEKIWEKDENPGKIVESMGLAQISDTNQLLGMVKEIIKNNPDTVKDYQGGNKKALAFFVGQIMKASKGKANPQLVNKLLIEELDK